MQLKEWDIFGIVEQELLDFTNSMEELMVRLD